MILLLYNEVTSEVPESSCQFNKNVKLRNNLTFEFEILVEGGFEIVFWPIDSISKAAYKIDIELDPQNGFSNPKMLNYSEDYLSAGSFHSNENEKFTAEIKNIDPRLRNKSVRIDVIDYGATASKNLYFNKEFLPLKKKMLSNLLYIATGFLSIYLLSFALFPRRG